MATPSGKAKKGGFDSDFVEKPPVIQSECPVCLQVLREPHLVSCCGYSFCHACINRIQADNKPCPTCNEENFSTLHNKGLQRSLYEFQVYCSHKEKGCDWKGELGQLDNHLNLSPQPDKQLEGCKYSEIECIYCSELIKRCDITTHQSEHCPKRPFSCEYCHSYESHYEDVMHNHWPVCGYHPVHCPNECGKLPQRQALENHIAEDCPKTVIDCDFRHVGCDVRLPRTDMPTHLKENLVTHTSLQAASHSKLLDNHTTLLATCNELQDSHTTLVASQKDLKARHSKLQDKTNKLERENETLKHQLQATQKDKQEATAKAKELETQIEMLTQLELVTRLEGVEAKVAKLELPSGTEQQTVPKISVPTPSYVEFTMENFEQHKKDKDRWYSRPFYTGPGGYKFCLNVDANGSGEGEGTHVSVYVCLLRGEYDDHLKFPFRGDITVQLVDQEGGEEHCTKTISFTAQTRDDVAGRVTEVKRRAYGKGWHEFISHGQLKPKYLKNDCLCFRITKITF